MRDTRDLDREQLHEGLGVGTYLLPLLLSLSLPQACREPQSYLCPTPARVCGEQLCGYQAWPGTEAAACRFLLPTPASSPAPHPLQCPPVASTEGGIFVPPPLSLAKPRTLCRCSLQSVAGAGQKQLWSSLRSWSAGDRQQKKGGATTPTYT